MSKKELGNKSHKLRRTFIISTIATVALALSVGVFAGMAAKPILLAMNACLLVGSVGIMVGTGVALNKVYESVSVKINESRASNALEKIKEMEQDGSSKYSETARAKILRKYAKANLRLSRFRGATPFGEWHTTSGLNQSGTEQLNRIDAYNILKDTSTSARGAKKWSKKIRLAEGKLARVTTTEGTKSSKCKWTKSFENVVAGATVLDRRTEIACLTPYARDAFKTMMQSSSEAVDDKCITVFMTFNSASAITPCVARAEDQTKASAIREILIYDALEACKDKTPLEIRSMFPLTIETKLVNKKSTRLLSRDTITVASYADLQQLTQKTTIRE